MKQPKVGGMKKGDRFNYEAEERKLVNISPGPVTGGRETVASLPKIDKCFGTKKYIL